MSIKKNAGSIAVFILLFVISFIFIIPFIWTMLTSLKPDEEIYSYSPCLSSCKSLSGPLYGYFYKTGQLL